MFLPGIGLLVFFVNRTVLGRLGALIAPSLQLIALGVVSIPIYFLGLVDGNHFTL